MPAVLRKARSLVALLAILVLAVIISPQASDGSRIFLEAGNLTDILRQISLIGMISLAMTFVILTGGIDLSVGSILALSTALTAMLLTRAWPTASYGSHIALAIAAAIAISALAGAVNGIAIATLRVQPFIVTLASMIGLRGLAKWLTNNENIDIGFGRDVAARFAEIFREKAVVIGAFAAAAAIFWTLLDRTVFGRYVRAIGDNEKAAEYTGLPIRRTKIWVYSLTGLLAGIAGVLYAAENHQGNPNAGVAYELDAIAAVVIGGTRLSGGKGSISGTIVGTLIMGVLTNMLRLNNVDSNVEMMIKAVIIVLAVAVQREKRMTRRTFVASAAVLAAGCGVGKKQQLVAFSQANNAEPYRAAQNALMTRLFADDKDVRLAISDAQQDNSKQVAQVETFIRQKPGLLIVAPNERAALTAVMGEAMAAGIPVICLERDILQPNYRSYVHSDNVAIGRLAGRFIADHLQKKYGKLKGNVVAMRGLLGVEGEINRERGAKEILDRSPDIRIVADPVADWIQSKAKDRMTEVLRAQPHIDVVYGHNDPMAVGAYLAAKELGREQEMIFVGVDGLGGSAGGIQKVIDGVLAATFVYPLCVDKAVEIGRRILHEPGFQPEKEYVLESLMVTKENAAEMYQRFTVI